MTPVEAKIISQLEQQLREFRALDETASTSEAANGNEVVAETSKLRCGAFIMIAAGFNILVELMAKNAETKAVEARP
jgi:hypothetical protein